MQSAVRLGIGSSPAEADMIFQRHVAQERFYLPRILAMHDENGGPVGVAAVLYDLTRFRLLDAMKTNLVATVSHELKSPLTGVRMALHLLLEGSLGPLTPRQQDMVATECDDAERLLRILNDLLDLARLDEGATALHREVVTAEALVQEVVADFAETVASAGLKLTTDVAANLPRIPVDVPRIRHVFANLISNAIKHSPPGGQIVLRARHVADDHLEFSIHDDGPGIAPEFHARIFERFFRVHGVSCKPQGRGVALAPQPQHSGA